MLIVAKQKIIYKTKNIQMQTGKVILVFLLFLFLLTGCQDEKDFLFEIEDLYNQWGIPQVIEPGFGNIELEAPTIFYPEGLVEIGPSRIDYWSVMSERTIFMEQSRETWFIINLSPDTLYVERNAYPDGTFIVKCIYFPAE